MISSRYPGQSQARQRQRLTAHVKSSKKETLLIRRGISKMCKVSLVGRERRSGGNYGSAGCEQGGSRLVKESVCRGYSYYRESGDLLSGFGVERQRR